MDEKALAVPRKFRAVGLAGEELAAERHFERGKAPGDGGVIEREGFRSRQNLPVAGDGEENANVVPVHDEPLLPLLTSP
ncbi:hypothetical protein D3C84_1244100 [compost metagenome]